MGASCISSMRSVSFFGVCARLCEYGIYVSIKPDACEAFIQYSLIHLVACDPSILDANILAALCAFAANTGVYMSSSIDRESFDGGELGASIRTFSISARVAICE